MSLLNVVLTTALTIASGIIAALFTYLFTRRREHEADWRKLKLAQYQEFVMALSGILEGRATEKAHQRYADAWNGMLLVAPREVLDALDAFQGHITYKNKNRDEGTYGTLQDQLFRVMRKDVYPGNSGDQNYSFRLIDVPPTDR